MIMIKLKDIMPANTRKTYCLRRLCKKGKHNVKTRPESQFRNVPIAIAELLAFCLKHSAEYIKGIGPWIKKETII
jgi:hypothetical protein